MRFLLDDEQAAFATSLERLLTDADPVAVARAWADGDHQPGLRLWARLAEQGVAALVVPEPDGGLGASAVELAVAFEALGRHVVPGPWVESAAHLPAAVAPGEPLLAQLAAGTVATVAAPPYAPLAADADAAAVVLVAGDRLRIGEPGAEQRSIDTTRRLFPVTPTADGPATGDLDRAFDQAALAVAAELLGCGERILADTVAYAAQRQQFGRQIGSYQALKHQLADVRIALDFVRPLVLGAAVGFDGPDRARDVSAARVAANDAARLAARVGLQVHGAIGYTREFDLSLWLLRVRALSGAWGTSAQHRDRVRAALVAGRS